jgi:predicted nucleic acid-binding Zn ribbon protein
MSRLVCEKCGGYYKLKEGESPEDFKSCQCGGNLKYVQNFNSHIDEEMDPLNEINICPSCGTEAPSSEKYCKSCNTIKSKEENLKESNTQKDIIRILAVITGILIVLIPLFLIDQNYALVLIVIGGLVASLAASNDEERVLNGIIVGVIAGLILLIFRSNITFSSEISYFNVFVFEMIGPLIIHALFGLLGGLINILIRYLFSKI